MPLNQKVATELCFCFVRKSVHIFMISSTDGNLLSEMAAGTSLLAPGGQLTIQLWWKLLIQLARIIRWIPSTRCKCWEMHLAQGVMSYTCTCQLWSPPCLLLCPTDLKADATPKLRQITSHMLCHPVLRGQSLGAIRWCLCSLVLVKHMYCVSDIACSSSWPCNTYPNWAQALLLEPRQFVHTEMPYEAISLYQAKFLKIHWSAYPGSQAKKTTSFWQRC